MTLPKRFIYHVLLSVLTLFCLPMLSKVGRAQTPHLSTQNERAQVEAFLREWKRTNLIPYTAFDIFKPMGKRAIPLLAAYLRDKELGYLAQEAMARLDPRAAMQFVLKDLPAHDPNIQRETFRLANRQLREYDWYVRAGKPKIDSSEPAPRYPRNTEPYLFRKEIHDAAVQTLRSGSINGAQAEAILTVGLTGSAHDFPLLRKWAANADTGSWEGNYHALALAALARLGDKAALATIAAELALPVLPHPAHPYVLDGTEGGRKVDPRLGAVVASRDDSQRVRTVAFQAGFSMNHRFIPLLLRHMDDPPGQFYGDYSDPSPAEQAMTALSQIVRGDEYHQQTGRSPQEWKQWGRDQGFALR